MQVSILIPCYNAERWIAQAIQSALAQSWSDKEVIVVDDGSSDRSLEEIRRFDGQIRWESGPNRGGGAARNRLLQLAQGEWVQYLDADDTLMPDKIAAQVGFLQQRGSGDIDVICSPIIEEYVKDGRLLRTERRQPEPLDPWVLLASWHLPQTGGPLWKRAALQAVGGWRVGQPCCQEHELYLRLLQAGLQFAFCDRALAIYRNWNHGRRVTIELREEVNRQRIAIFDRMESWLTEHQALTPLRRRAINDARHGLARGAWSYDQAFALQIMGRIAQSDPTYVPSRGPASPALYRMTYHVLGFRGAEYIAQLKRVLTGFMGGRPGGRMAEPATPA